MLNLVNIYGCLATKLSVDRFLHYDLLAATRKMGQEARWSPKDFILYVTAFATLYSHVVTCRVC
jgi:hypothetical protein